MPQKIINTFKSLGLGLSLETYDIFFESLGIGIEKFGLGKKVSVSVSKTLVSEKKSRYWYRKIWSRKKSLGLGIGKFGLGKKVSVLVSEKKSRYWSWKIWSWIKSLVLGLEKFGLG